MKDFTKKQKKADFLKCNTCSTIVKAFGVEPGAHCVSFAKAGENLGASAEAAHCSGVYIAFDARAADALKRRTDGSA